MSEMFYVQANFPHPDGGWKNIYNIPFEKGMALSSLRQGKRDNSELEFRIISSVSQEIISESEILKGGK